MSSLHATASGEDKSFVDSLFDLYLLRFVDAVSFPMAPRGTKDESVRQAFSPLNQLGEKLITDVVHEDRIIDHDTIRLVANTLVEAGRAIEDPDVRLRFLAQPVKHWYALCLRSNHQDVAEELRQAVVPLGIKSGCFVSGDYLSEEKRLMSKQALEEEKQQIARQEVIKLLGAIDQKQTQWEAWKSPSRNAVPSMLHEDLKFVRDGLSRNEGAKIRKPLAEVADDFMRTFREIKGLIVLKHSNAFYPDMVPDLYAVLSGMHRAFPKLQENMTSQKLDLTDFKPRMVSPSKPAKLKKAKPLTAES